ncbi:MAG: T9SS type A sorting domain-containing protein [Bacteroidota bacterium]|nr:T9SS type A sorting domain-containing protein [Bacteroidota bacterium]
MIFLSVYLKLNQIVFSVKFKEVPNEKLILVLQNQQGQTVRQINVKQTGSLRISMLTQNLTSGVYLLTIQGKKVFPVKKVIIETEP